MSEPTPDAASGRNALEAMRTLLSDDHSDERGRAALHDLLDQIVREEGEAGLSELGVTLSVGLARALEQIASEQGLVAADFAEVWFAE